MTTINNLWNWLTLTTYTGPVWGLILALGIGGVGALAPQSWNKTNLLATWVHETGHAVTALFLGRKVTKIVIHKNGSGYTEHLGERKKFRLLLITFAGYPAPGLVGWGIIETVTHSKNHIALVVILVVSVIMIFLQRSLISLGINLVIITGILLLTQVSLGVSTYFLTIIAGYLLVSSPKTIIALHETRKENKKRKQVFHSDSGDLAKLTKIPSIFWEILFMTISLGFIYLSLNSIIIMK